MFFTTSPDFLGIFQVLIHLSGVHKFLGGHSHIYMIREHNSKGYFSAYLE